MESKAEKQILTSVESVKLPLKVKIGYSVGNFGKALLAVSTSAFLLYFYTNVCGIDAKIAATIILIAKIWDICNDPMMGAIVDRTISREGKCRFYLKYFSVPTGIMLTLTFVMPNFAMKGKIIWAAVTYILQGTLSTVLLIPLNTLMGRLTSDSQERTHMSQFSNLISLAGSMFVSGCMMKMVVFFGASDMIKGFAIVGILLGILYILCHFIVFWSTKGYEPLEEYRVTESGVQRKEVTRQPLKIIAAGLLKNRMWLAVVLMFLAVNMAMTLENSAMAFYFQYNHDNDMSLYSLYSVMGTIAGLIPVFVLNQITRRISFGKCALVGNILAMSGYLFRFVMTDSAHWIMGTGWFLYNFGSAMTNLTVLLLIFEAKEWGFQKTGVNNEAILMSGFSVSYKIGMALGGAVMGYLMPAAYVAGAASQTVEVQKFFFHFSTLYPSVLYVIAVIATIYICKAEREIK